MAAARPERNDLPARSGIRGGGGALLALWVRGVVFTDIAFVIGQSLGRLDSGKLVHAVAQFLSALRERWAALPSGCPPTLRPDARFTIHATAAGMARARSCDRQTRAWWP
jgi:hypothetical protein